MPFSCNYYIYAGKQFAKCKSVNKISIEFLQEGIFMRILFLVLVVVTSFLVINYSTRSEPGFNGTTPGCGGSGCHSSVNNLVSAEVLQNLQVRITVSGTTASVAGELVDTSGTVVAVNNSTSSNPFVLTAPAAGTYTVNAGFKNPSRQWGTTDVTIGITGVNDKLIGNNPESYELYANYPNPFNPSTTIRYALKENGFTTLKIFNVQGKEIAILINEEKPAGIYEINFDGLNLSSGTYFYELRSGNYSETRKMLLVK